MRSKDIDWTNSYEVCEYLTQPTVEREPDETDEHYKERLLKFIGGLNERSR